MSGEASGAKAAAYVLVRSGTEGFELYTRLRAAGVPARIAPVPHGLQACCGTSVLLDPADVPAARDVIDDAPFPIEDIVVREHAIDPARGRFC